MGNKKKEDIITGIIETGAEISGSVFGSVLGGLILGPVGAVLGGASGPIVTKTFKVLGTELKTRFLGTREEARIGGAFTFAISKIHKNESAGLTIRNDDFFSEILGERPASEEILEGVLLTSQREYEEQKIKFLGNLYANICFSSDVSREFANQLVRVTNDLSFRQLCILQLFKERLEEEKLDLKIQPLEGWNLAIMDIVAEVRNLQQRGLIFIPTTYDGGDNSSPLRLNKVKITPSGLFFCNMLSLDEIESGKLIALNKISKIKKL